MAYQGFLIKLGSESGPVLPQKYMAVDSYKATPAQRLDASESKRDASGVLHRAVLPNRPVHVEFDTPPRMTDLDVDELNALLRQYYSSEAERKLKLYYYDQESGGYVLRDCYLPDVQYPISHMEGTRIIYNPIHYEFIGY